MSSTVHPTQIELEFLYLDLATCDRCIGTDAQLDAALEVLGNALEPGTAQVELRKTLVATAEQARALQFASSPTIRINGRDIAGELVESSCEADACSCGGSTACRVWRYEGHDYNVAPRQLIVDAVLAELEGGNTSAPDLSEPFVLPPNLEQHFARRAATPPVSACCPPDQQAVCCEPEAKAACCGDTTSGTCGCS